MKKKLLMMILAAALALSACSGGSTAPATTRAVGQTLPPKPTGTTQAGSAAVPAPSTQAETEEPSGQSETETEPAQTTQAAETTQEPASSQAPETTEEVPPQTPEETQPSQEYFETPEFYTGKIYSVSSSYYDYEEENPFVMDPEGHLLDRSKLPRPIEDVLTENVWYYQRIEYEKTGDGWEDYQAYSTLYDDSGNVLEERAPYSYAYGCGDCVIRMDSRASWDWEGEPRDYGYCLYNPHTHEVMQEGVAWMQRLNDGSALAMDNRGYVLGVVDASGHALAGFPMETGPYRYPSVYGDRYILADCPDEVDGGMARVLLDTNLEYIDYAAEGESYNIFDCGEKGLILAKSIPEMGTYLFYLDEWEVAAVVGFPVTDMDAERILSEGENGTAVYDWNGELVSGFYDQIYPVGKKEGETAPYYICKNGNEVLLTDPDGMVLEAKTIDNLNYVSPYQGVVYCSTSYYDASTGYYGYGLVVLDEQLNQIVPDTYENATMVAPGIICCQNMNGNNEPRYTLFNMKGEAVFTGAECVGSGDEYAIAVVKGFTVGLIDHEGNWLAKNSRYEHNYWD